MDDELRGRIVFTWPGRNRRADTDELARAIAAAIPLYNDQGRLRLFDSATGELTGVNLARFRELIDKHLCGARIVRRGDRWLLEYFSFAFAPPPRHDPSKLRPDDDLFSEPDDAVLMEIYSRELHHRLPKVIET